MKLGNMFQNRLMHRIVDKFKRNKMKRIVIKFNREAVCMGDDVYNDIYEIKMLGDATVYDLMNIIKSGGNGNEWPTPMGFDWIVYSNIGRLAKIYSNKMKIDFYDIAPKTKLSNLRIEWVYAARETDVIDETRLESIFRD